MLEFLSLPGMFAIYGVVIGSLMSGGVAIFHGFLNRQRAAKFLAVVIVIALDRYVANCASALVNTPLDFDHERDPDDQFNMPDRLVLPEEPDWTSIPADLAHKILELPQRDAQAHEAVGTIWHLADGSAARSTRDDEFTRLAIEASEIARDLRTRYGLPARPHADWDPVSEIKQFRTKYLSDRDSASAAIDFPVQP